MKTIGLKIGTFTGTAEVNGVRRRVEYDGGMLHVECVTHDDALTLLGLSPQGYPESWDDAVEGPRAELIASRGEAPTPDASPSAALAEQRAKSQAMTDKARADSQARTAAAREQGIAAQQQLAVVATRAAREREAAAEPIDTTGPRGGPRLENGTPMVDDRAARTKREVAAVTEAPAADDEIPFGAEDGEALKTAFLAGLVSQSTIRGLLQHFISNDITDRNEIIAICKQHKKEVPVLTRVSNLDDRLGRALEALESP